ncbi:berberine and berberine like family protein [Mycobacterium xenopi 3993]|nr:berberine and berberine like family protein [Mycobacterium xenopi 3993]
MQWYVETSDVPAATRWLDVAHQAVQPYSVGGYVNYLEANQPASRYFGSNLARLTAVRQKYDPGRSCSPVELLTADRASLRRTGTPAHLDRGQPASTSSTTSRS